jgi:hypothetical protein
MAAATYNQPESPGMGARKSWQESRPRGMLGSRRASAQAGRSPNSHDLGPVGDDEDYVWGQSIDIKDLEPGDILQLRDHLVKDNYREEIHLLR